MSETKNRREVEIRTGRLVVSVSPEADGCTVEFTPNHFRRATAAIVIRGDEAMASFAKLVIDAERGGLANACVDLADQLESVWHGVPEVVISALERVPVEA